MTSTKKISNGMTVMTMREAALADGISRHLIATMDETHSSLSRELVAADYAYTPEGTYAAGGIVVRSWPCVGLSYPNGDRTKEPTPYRLARGVALVAVNGKISPVLKWTILI